MIDKVTIDYEGPDGDWLVIEDDDIIVGGTQTRLRLSDEACQQLDAALQPWREHQAEGQHVRALFDAHKRSGRCTAWMAGLGPCMLDANHEGDHWSHPCR